MTMKISTNPNWLSAEVQARIDPPPIPLSRAVTEKAKKYDIIKIKMRRDHALATSKTYELKIATTRLLDR